MQQATVQRILQQYGLQATKLYPVQKGYRNESHPVQLQDGRLVNLILYKHEPKMLSTIRRTNAVSAFLAGHGVSARAPLGERIMKLSSAKLVRYACLYNYLPGETIPWEAYTQGHIKLLGQTMAELHRTLVTYGGALPPVAEEYQKTVARMARYFADAPVGQATSAKLQLAVAPKVLTRLLYILTFCEKLPGQQALHMDFVRSNILFSADHEARITGILDFEKAAYGHPLFDVARTLAFLLVDCKYKPTDKVRAYFLDSGYQKRGHRRLDRILVRAGSKRRLLLEELLDLFLLYDFYKFLRHNPYEFLPQNEHFVRTRDLLLKRGVITTTLLDSRRSETLLQ